MNFDPIGYVEASQKYKYQQPRQGEFARNRGKIILSQGCNYEQALEDLQGFDKIWIIYLFHQNSGWRPKVNTPVSPDGKKKGVFATRSPYRPNPIGLSCVDLISIDGLELTIGNFDLLDQTPVLDIKPYISHYDSHPDASTGWLPQTAPEENRITFSPAAQSRVEWLLENDGPDLVDLTRVQLALDPTNRKRKRVKQLSSGLWELAFRTWRIEFSYDEMGMSVVIESIGSAYSVEDLLPESEDPYLDKDLHRGFISIFQ